MLNRRYIMIKSWIMSQSTYSNISLHYSRLLLLPSTSSSYFYFLHEILLHLLPREKRNEESFLADLTIISVRERKRERESERTDGPKKEPVFILSSSWLLTEFCCSISKWADIWICAPQVSGCMCMYAVISVWHQQQLNPNEELVC